MSKIVTSIARYSAVFDPRPAGVNSRGKAKFSCNFLVDNIPEEWAPLFASRVASIKAAAKARGSDEVTIWAHSHHAPIIVEEFNQDSKLRCLLWDCRVLNIAPDRLINGMAVRLNVSLFEVDAPGMSVPDKYFMALNGIEVNFEYMNEQYKRIKREAMEAREEETEL